MLHIIKNIIFIGMVCCIVACDSRIVDVQNTKETPMNVYDHTCNDIFGNSYDLSELQGKVTLIVNVASHCGYTGQYKDLQLLNDKYDGFQVIGFPCNDFGGQEPGSEKEIKEFCSTRYGVTFPMYAKISVNEPGRHPLYETLVGYLSETKGKVKWNFTKILVSREGTPIARFGSLTFPSSGKLRKAIEKALEE